MAGNLFGKMAADTLGLSDIGKIIAPADYDKTDADDYVMHEDQEKIYFLIKTKQDEYCFTNLALVHVDGESAVSSKRMLKRYPYAQYKISNVMLETAGRMDLDVEIKFSIGSINFDIDVRRDQLELLKDLYKSLVRISELTLENEIYSEMAVQSLDKAAQTLQNARTNENELTRTYKDITNFSFEWLMSSHEKYHLKDFGFVFEKYLNN